MIRTFHIHFHCLYKSDKNLIEKLELEILEQNKWQKLEINQLTGGFLLFINGLFSCQHLYLRANCAERQLVLNSATGDLKIEATEFWHITKAKIHFDAVLKSGNPNQEDMDYILGRMPHCPVSSNLDTEIKIKNTVCFVNADTKIL